MRNVPLSELRTWTLPHYFKEGEAWFESGKVEQVSEQDGVMEGRLSIRDRAQICRFRFNERGLPVNECPCRVNRQEGMICGHVIAVMLAWRATHADPLAERRARIDKLLQTPPERRHHFRRLGPTGVQTRLRLRLRKKWADELDQGKLHLIPVFEIEGQIRRPDQLHPGQVLKLDERDQFLLALLEDLNGRDLPPVFEIEPADFCQVLDTVAPESIGILGHQGKLRLHREAQLPMLSVSLLPDSGELELSLQVDLPHKSSGPEHIRFVVSKNRGWVLSGDQAWPLEGVPPAELAELANGAIRIPRSKVLPFIKDRLPELESQLLVDNQVPDNAFHEVSLTPPFRLRLKGGANYVSGVLHALYGEVEVLADGDAPKETCSLPDPEDPLAYGGRNREAEQKALATLRALGFAAESGDRLGTIEGRGAILNLLAAARYELETEGWQIELRGQLESLAQQSAMLLARVSLQQQGDAPDWFRFDLTLKDTRGDSLTEASLRRARERGEYFVQQGEQVVLLPPRQTRLLTDVLREAKPSPDGSLRVPKQTCGYVDSLLDPNSGIPVERDTAWLETAAAQTRNLELEALEPLPRLNATLRPYQDLGVRWLRRLERGGYGGILADEMGLGKTLQTLAWLSLPRIHNHEPAPALVVCPSALVANWVEEILRFLPDFKVLALEGARRADLWEQVPEQDLAVISYAVLRRDAARAEAVNWSAVVLDEAQHIKNPGTQNAKTAKKLRAPCRVVLSGTPMENQVTDLWSLMDFLMPGYLGTQSDFTKRFTRVIEKGDAGADTALNLLHRKLSPFLLRRMKREVAKDLPPRLERRVFCDLTPAQRKLYDQVRAEVAEEVGAGRSKLSVLRGLMRLRQICGHPALIGGESTTPEDSGKVELFFELLDEVIDGGHRVLVFSAFTSMLGILRELLDEREISYSYLDGSTKDRLERVHAFNENPDIPLFLISLKAGGTGLNLTGADVVIHLDPWWNPAAEDQATDRAHRIGQEKTVYAMKLITRDTVEARVAVLQDRKRGQVEAALAGSGNSTGTLSWTEIRDLIDL